LGDETDRGATVAGEELAVFSLFGGGTVIVVLRGFCGEFELEPVVKVGRREGDPC
jgi:hypothetical protein